MKELFKQISLAQDWNPNDLCMIVQVYSDLPIKKITVGLHMLKCFNSITASSKSYLHLNLPQFKLETTDRASE